MTITGPNVIYKLGNLIAAGKDCTCSTAQPSEKHIYRWKAYTLQAEIQIKQSEPLLAIASLEAALQNTAGAWEPDVTLVRENLRRLQASHVNYQRWRQGSSHYEVSVNSGQAVKRPADLINLRRFSIFLRPPQPLKYGLPTRKGL